MTEPEQPKPGDTKSVPTGEEQVVVRETAVPSRPEKEPESAKVDDIENAPKIVFLLEGAYNPNFTPQQMMNEFMTVAAPIVQLFPSLSFRYVSEDIAEEVVKNFHDIQVRVAHEKRDKEEKVKEPKEPGTPENRRANLSE